MSSAPARTARTGPPGAGRWRQLGVIGLAELLALAPWFGASVAALANLGFALAGDFVGALP